MVARIGGELVPNSGPALIVDQGRLLTGVEFTLVSYVAGVDWVRQQSVEMTAREGFAAALGALLPEREIMTGIGPVAVRAPRIRDRLATGEERIAFSSAILPPYARRSKSLEVLIPILYLKGISTGGFEEALAALLGKDAGGLSASTI